MEKKEKGIDRIQALLPYTKVITHETAEAARAAVNALPHKITITVVIAHGEDGPITTNVSTVRSGTPRAMALDLSRDMVTDIAWCTNRFGRDKQTQVARIKALMENSRRKL